MTSLLSASGFFVVVVVVVVEVGVVAGSVGFVFAAEVVSGFKVVGGKAVGILVAVVGDASMG